MSANSIRNEDYTSLDFLQQLVPSSNKISSQSHSSNRVISIGHRDNLYSSDRISSQKNVHNGIGTHHSNVAGLGQVKLVRAHSLLDTNQSHQMKNFKLFYDALVKGMYERQECDSLWRKFEASADNTYQLQHFIWQFNKKKQAELLQNNRKHEQMILTLKKKIRTQIQQEVRPKQTKNQEQIEKKQQKKIKKALKSKSQIKSGKTKIKNNQQVGSEKKIQSPIKKQSQKELKFNKISLGSPKNTNVKLRDKNSRKYPRVHKSLENKQYKRQELVNCMRKELGYIRKIIQHGQKFIHS